nr:hypothetical protein [Tanacetum cinerariifolium]
RRPRRRPRPEVTLPPRKRLDIALGPRYEVGKSSFAAAARPAGGLRSDYSFVATVDREIVRDPERGICHDMVRIFQNLTGVTTALAARDALRSTNGEDSHNSEADVRRTERANRECTYTDFLKCQPLPFKGTEGFASLS